MEPRPCFTKNLVITNPRGTSSDHKYEEHWIISSQTNGNVVLIRIGYHNFPIVMCCIVISFLFPIVHNIPS
jgi:hypothetical protein